jgi:hypothetical protein
VVPAGRLVVAAGWAMAFTKSMFCAATMAMPPSTKKKTYHQFDVFIGKSLGMGTGFGLEASVSHVDSVEFRVSVSAFRVVVLGT